MADSPVNNQENNLNNNLNNNTESSVQNSPEESNFSGKNENFISSQIDRQLEFREADKIAKQTGFSGGLEQAYYYYYANFLSSINSQDPQAQVTAQSLEKLWNAGKYSEALKYAEHVFGQSSNKLNFNLNINSHELGNRFNNNFSYAFASKAEYQKAKKSSDPIVREKANKAWKEWMESYQKEKDPKNIKTPFPI